MRCNEAQVAGASSAVTNATAGREVAVIIIHKVRTCRRHWRWRWGCPCALRGAAFGRPALLALLPPPFSAASVLRLPQRTLVHIPRRGGGAEGALVSECIRPSEGGLRGWRGRVYW